MGYQIKENLTKIWCSVAFCKFQNFGNSGPKKEIKIFKKIVKIQHGVRLKEIVTQIQMFQILMYDCVLYNCFTKEIFLLYLVIFIIFPITEKLYNIEIYIVKNILCSKYWAYSVAQVAYYLQYIYILNWHLYNAVCVCQLHLFCVGVTTTKETKWFWKTPDWENFIIIFNTILLDWKLN